MELSSKQKRERLGLKAKEMPRKIGRQLHRFTRWCTCMLQLDRAGRCVQIGPSLVRSQH